jgi:hypothetical protein
MELLFCFWIARCYNSQNSDGVFNPVFINPTLGEKSVFFGKRNPVRVSAIVAKQNLKIWKIPVRVSHITNLRNSTTPMEFLVKSLHSTNSRTRRGSMLLNHMMALQ